MRASIHTLSVILLVLAVPPISAAGEQTGPVDFDKAVAPILAERCLSCHSGASPKGKLDLSSRSGAARGGRSGVVIVGGKPGESLLWQNVDADKMPPKKPLPQSERAVLCAWIAAGARWGTDPIDPFRISTDKRAGYDWWSLQPVRRPAIPLPANGPVAANPIDLFIRRRLEREELQPSPPADKQTLIRRLSFDLLGLPPSPEEVRAFLADDKADAYARLVERYLASPHYGVRWARHWLDVVRFGESNGFEHDEFRPNAWPYRDWVVNALNTDLPYDEFARRQLAGDVLLSDDGSAITATGFLVSGSYDSVGQTQQSQVMRRVVRQDELEDIIGTVGQTFLGLTVHCARCHDHKFDPIRQTEYYSLAAGLAGVRHGEREIQAEGHEAIALGRRLVEIRRQLAELEQPVREAIIAERGRQPASSLRPIARWDFSSGLSDLIGSAHAALHGNACLVADGLAVAGKDDFAATVPLERGLHAKTLEVWVTLSKLDQRGGGVISVQSLNGGQFDAIVYGELEPGRWMAGSEGFVRYKSFSGPVEREADRQPVHLAISYAADGTVSCYRDGRPYGQSYRLPGLLSFPARQTQVLFGLRHLPAGGNRLLAGVIHRAQLFDRALSAAEIAASVAGRGDFVTGAEIGGQLRASDRQTWHKLKEEIRAVEAKLSGQARKVYAVVPRQPDVTRNLIRGNPEQPGEVVAAGAIAGVAGLTPELGLAPEAPEADCRRRLAQWITHPRNPLFARVIVNRLWHYHFGMGIVDTPNDLGFNGGRPAHPELLDWLAAELIQQDFSLKRLHRLIVTSDTYRQASLPVPAAVQRDATNRLLWRKSPMRLEAESVRDAMLRVTGRLNERLGGPGFQEFKLSRQVGTTTNNYAALDTSGPEFERRTLYRAWARGGRSRLLDAFDCPDPATTAPARAVTTTPLQALTMLNHSLVLRMADALAERLVREAGADVDGQIARAYWHTLGRPPLSAELARARQAVGAHGLSILARALFNCSEFLFVD